MEISRTMGKFVSAGNTETGTKKVRNEFTLNNCNSFEDEFTRQNLQKAYLSLSKSFRKMADNFKENIRFNT